MKAKVVKGKQKGEEGFVITDILSPGDYTAVVEFEDESLSLFDYEDLEFYMPNNKRKE